MSSSTAQRLFALVALSYLLTLSFALPSHHDHHDHSHSVPFRASEASGAWYQPDDHPVHALFKRDTFQTDGQTYATVGTAEWAAPYPPGKVDTTKLPQSWVDALDAAVAAGKIPNIPPSTMVNGMPVYAGNLDPNGATVCSTTVKCNKNPEVVWNAPPGVWATSFDDGPLPTSDKLYQFLQENDEHATHFFIGVNILNNPKEFMTAFDTMNDDIAVHTWTHPQMTTFNNSQVLGELGWTIQIIHNSTGGRIPTFWRPPYGDADNRVIAIAKEVFGLTTVIWNQDTEDWSIPDGSTTIPKVEAQLTKWLTGPKTPGLVVLEHELAVQTVQVFIDIYPQIKANGWQTISLARMNNSVPYQNAADSTGPVSLVSDITQAGGEAAAANASASSAAPSASISSSPSSSSIGNSSASAPVSSDKPAVTGTVKSNSALSFTLDAPHWQSKAILATFLTLGLSLVAFS